MRNLKLIATFRAQINSILLPKTNSNRDDTKIRTTVPEEANELLRLLWSGGAQRKAEAESRPATIDGRTDRISGHQTSWKSRRI